MDSSRASYTSFSRNVALRDTCKTDRDIGGDVANNQNVSTLQHVAECDCSLGSQQPDRNFT